jgi:hypothetical protein
MYMKYIGSGPEWDARVALIEKILPKETLVEQFLLPKVHQMFPMLVRMLYTELEIYRAYPKKPLEESGKAKVAVKTFDARNHTKCFQGKAFEVKDNTWGDADLKDYRTAIGTFNHAEWGDATLLEIWGADHMKEHRKMVTQAFKYGANLISTRPVLKFHVNPLFMNNKSGKTKLTDEQKIDKFDMDLLLAEAQMYGTRTPEQARRASEARGARATKAQKLADDQYLAARKKYIGV